MKIIALQLAVFSAILSGCCFVPGMHVASVSKPIPAPVATKPAEATVVVPTVVDSDHDGVPDDKDRCPASPLGSTVNSFGCPPSEKVSIALRVEFDTNKAVVKPEYDEQLRKVSDFLKTYPVAKAEIEGHTDSLGSAEINKNLSQRRADAVRQALIERFGVDGSRLSSVGYGSERPIAGNDTPAGRAQNRRVIATFTSTKS